MAEVRPDAPAAVLMVQLETRQVVYANPTAVQMAPGLSLPVGAEEWSAAADLRDLDGAPLDETGHPLSRVARFEPVAGQGVSAGRTTDLGARREPLWVVALPLDDAPNLAGHALVVFLPVQGREQLQERAATAHAGGGVDAVELQGAGGPASGRGPSAHDEVAVREAAVLATGMSFTVADARDPEMPLIWVNPAFTAVTGYTFDRAVGRNCRFLQGPSTDRAVTRRVRQALEAGETVTVTLLNHRADGTAFWNQVAMSPVHDAAGELTHYVGIQTDVSGRVAADAERDRALASERRARDAAESATERAEAAHGRLQLLAEVTRRLSETVDAEQALDRLAHLVVPALGDLAVLALVGDSTALPSAPDPAAGGAVGGGVGISGRGLRDVAWWHHDPALVPLVSQHARGRLASLSPQGREVLAELMVDGRVQLVRPGPGEAPVAEQVRPMLRPGPALDALAALDPSSLATFPLRGRGRTVGLLTVATGPGRAPLSDDELELGRDIAARAGLALEASRLYRQQRDLAAGLQRSLLALTRTPQPDHLQVAVRYVASAEAAQVGGDFYDAFTQPGGATVVVIGDVMGHDTQAAAAMAQLRSIVRALGVVGDDGPAAVLRRADEVMAALGVDTTATALVARLEDRPAAAAASDGAVATDLVWSSAGHPPAMLIGPDGAVVPLAAERTDLLLGVDPSTARHEAAAEVVPGATLLLYTDGLVERREQSLSQGLARLRAELADLAAAHLDLEALVDELLVRLVPDQPGDDVALIAVRLHPVAG